MRIIVDTNVFVSGLLNKQSTSGKIVDAILQGILVAVVSKVTFQELSEVLQRRKFQPYFQRAQVDPEKFLALLETLVEFVEIQPIDHKEYIRDSKDRPFLELAATFPPPAFLITGDKDFEQHCYSGVQVISVSQFVRQFI